MSDEDNDYGDDDFEDFEVSGTFSGKSVKPVTSTKEASPNPKPNPHHVRLQQIQQQESPSAAVKKPATPRAATTNSEDYNPDEDNDNDGDDDGEEEEQSKPDLLAQMGGVVDLESYLKNMLASPPAANEDEEDDEEENKELQPLEGVQPEDEDQRRLQAKLGYSPEKKGPSLHQATSPSPTLSQSSVANFQPHHIGAPPKVSPGGSSTQLKSGDHGDDHVAQLLAMAGASVNRSSATKNSSDVENALKVDALLRDLFPDRYKDKETPVAAAIPPKKTKGKTKSKKAAVGGAQQYGLGAPRPPRKPSDYADEDEEEENYRTDEGDEGDYRRKSSGGGGSVGGGGGGDLLGGLEQQLKMLKKELKTKDDKIQRLTEHSMMMANQLDKFRGEVARLNARLHEAQMELEAKEARLVEAMRKKKKDQKKKQTEEKDLSGASASVYEGEIIRLREREQALMDAVEELSSQNEDLIVKLRESMQRELELSSKRAQLVSHTVHRSDGIAGGGGGGGSMLPSIHEKHGVGGGGMLRAQTEPALNNGYGSSNNHHEEYAAKAAGKKKKKHSSG